MLPVLQHASLLAFHSSIFPANMYSRILEVAHHTLAATYALHRALRALCPLATDAFPALRNQDGWYFRPDRPRLGQPGGCTRLAPVLHEQSGIEQRVQVGAQRGVV